MGFMFFSPTYLIDPQLFLELQYGCIVLAADIGNQQKSFCTTVSATSTF